MLTFRALDLADVDWALLDSLGDRTVFQTRAWLEFIADTQGATPVVAEIRDGGERVGFFSGLTFTRLGVRMLGSSARGWTTAYMGFNLLADVARRDLVPALERFAFDELRCLHYELSDRYMTTDDGDALGLAYEGGLNYESDLRLPEDALLAGMNASRRNCVRQAAKLGVVVEEAHDLGFADEYYEQLRVVFAKHGLVPTYGVERVRALIAHLLPTGRLLLLRARAPDGSCIATSIVPGMNRLAYFWGNASHKHGLKYHPNEALHWYAMRYWKARGVAAYDWGGPGEYKAKYGGHPIRVPRFFRSRYKVLERLRGPARRLFAVQLRARGWARSLGAHGARGAGVTPAPAGGAPDE